MRQVRVALIGTVFLLFYTAGVGLAEGESPTPLDSGAVAAAVVDQPAQPIGADAGSETSLAPTPESQPEPEPWRAVVDGLRPGYWDASVLPAQGVAMYYNPGVFQRVLTFRYGHDHISECDECIGYVALLRAGDIDRRVWLQRKDRIAEGPFWVVDVAAGRDIPGLLSRNWVVDIDNKTAMRWRMAGPIPITVYAAESPEAQEFAAAYFASEMIPLDERHFIPPEAYSYRVLDDDEMELKDTAPVPQPETPSANPAPAQPIVAEQKTATQTDGAQIESIEGID